MGPSRGLRRLHLLLRPTWGAEAWTVRHIRRNLEALTRAHAARMATGHADAAEEADLRSLERLNTALPAPVRRWPLVLGSIVAILISQALLDWLLRFLADAGPASDDDALQKALGKLDIAPDVQALGDLGRAIVASDVAERFAFLAAICLTLFLVLRPAMSGFRLAQWLITGSGHLPPWRSRADLHREASRLHLQATEREVMAAHGLLPFTSPPLDIVTKVLILLPAVYLAGYWFEGGTAGIPAAIWLLAAALAMRMAVLAVQLRGRHRTVWWLAGPAAAVALAAVVSTAPSTSLQTADLAASYATRTADAPEGVVIERRPSAALRLTLSTSPTLQGADLEGRNLYRFFLSGKRMTTANLAYADLQWANIRGATLDHAHLGSAMATGADLRGARLRHADLQRAHLDLVDLREADLRYADLRNAHVRGTDLRGANLRHAQLGGADVAYADLRRAKLHEAQLGTTLFDCTDVRAANRRRATLPALDWISVIANARTRWPPGRRPEALGLLYGCSDNPEPLPSFAGGGEDKLDIFARREPADSSPAIAEQPPPMVGLSGP